MKIFRFSISLRLTHPFIDAQTITSEIGLPRREPVIREFVHDRTSFDPASKLTYWLSKAQSGEDSQLLDVIKDYLDVLEKRTPFVNHFAATGGTLQLSVGWFASSRVGGVTVDHQLLCRIAALNIDLLLDVTATDEEPNDPY